MYNEDERKQNVKTEENEEPNMNAKPNRKRQIEQLNLKSSKLKVLTLLLLLIIIIIIVVVVTPMYYVTYNRMYCDTTTRI